MHVQLQQAPVVQVDHGYCSEIRVGVDRLMTWPGILFSILEGAAILITCPDPSILPFLGLQGMIKVHAVHCQQCPLLAMKQERASVAHAVELGSCIGLCYCR